MAVPLDLLLLFSCRVQSAAAGGPTSLPIFRSDRGPWTVRVSVRGGKISFIHSTVVDESTPPLTNRPLLLFRFHSNTPYNPLRENRTEPTGDGTRAVVIS